MKKDKTNHPIKLCKKGDIVRKAMPNGSYRIWLITEIYDSGDVRREILIGIRPLDKWYGYAKGNETSKDFLIKECLVPFELITNLEIMHNVFENENKET